MCGLRAALLLAACARTIATRALAPRAAAALNSTAAPSFAPVPWDKDLNLGFVYALTAVVALALCCGSLFAACCSCCARCRASLPGAGATPSAALALFVALLLAAIAHICSSEAYYIDVYANADPNGGILNTLQQQRAGALAAMPFFAAVFAALSLAVPAPCSRRGRWWGVGIGLAALITLFGACATALNAAFDPLLLNIHNVESEPIKYCTVSTTVPLIGPFSVPIYVPRYIIDAAALQVTSGTLAAVSLLAAAVMAFRGGRLDVAAFLATAPGGLAAVLILYAVPINALTSLNLLLCTFPLDYPKYLDNFYGTFDGLGLSGAICAVIGISVRCCCPPRGPAADSEGGGDSVRVSLLNSADGGGGSAKPQAPTVWASISARMPPLPQMPPPPKPPPPPRPPPPPPRPAPPPRVEPAQPRPQPPAPPAQPGEVKWPRNAPPSFTTPIAPTPTFMTAPKPAAPKPLVAPARAAAEPAAPLPTFMSAAAPAFAPSFMSRAEPAAPAPAEAELVSLPRFTQRKAAAPGGDDAGSPS